MTFISYAQNFEDVILWRALKHVESGFYIDIGAQDPSVDSVSRGFYEQGWRGLHVEPTPVYAHKLREARGDEEVIEAAIGAGDANIVLYEIPGTGLSTGDQSIAEAHRNNEFPIVERKVTQMRLSALFDRVGEREIHWLKVDVEGMEKDVIDSWSPSHSRPWVVVVESTKPQSSEENFSGWDPILIDLGYEFVYFDGLNRFYVHSTKPELKGAFGSGPNLFDDFVLYGSSNPLTALFDERLRQRDADMEAIRMQLDALTVPIPPIRPTRILLDLSTSLQWRGKHAVGIVRTEREIAIRLLNDPTIDVVPVVFHHSSLRALDPQFACELVSPTLATVQPSSVISAVEPPSNSPLLQSMRQKLLRATIRALARGARALAKRVVRLAPSAAGGELEQSLIHGRQALRNLFYRPSPGSIVPANDAELAAAQAPIDLSLIVHPCKDDVLFIGGLGWDVVDCAALALIKARTEFKIATVIYDMIPIKHREFLGGDPKDYFWNYFLHMASLADHSFCISKCTEADFVAFCADSGYETPKTSILYLGANVPAKADSAEIDDKNLVKRLSKRRYALSVGTFEIRKNYKLILSLWHELVKDPEFDLDLVLVGMPGWRVDNIISEMEASPLFNKRIFWLKGLSDAGLSWLYDNCHVFLFPSLYEGWGLPVVEALQHRRHAIVSNRGSTPEAGMGLATIVDPDDREGWIREIRRYAEMGRLEVAGGVELPTWDGAARSVKDTLSSFNVAPDR